MGKKVFIYPAGVFITWLILRCTDEVINGRSFDELQKDVVEYLMYSIIWPLSLPIVIAYIGLTVYEKLTGNLIQNKEYINCFLGGILIVITMGLLIWM